MQIGSPFGNFHLETFSKSALQQIQLKFNFMHLKVCPFRSCKGTFELKYETNQHSNITRVKHLHFFIQFHAYVSNSKIGKSPERKKSPSHFFGKQKYKLFLFVKNYFQKNSTEGLQ